ncbi:MAG: AAA family ATPase [Bacteroidales bacterium]|jgi:AAA+ ATPase superfamily predicted ATPase|nr:AAA family ATPase [Bacteroidales bacterium]
MLIGREKEQQELQNILESNQSEFVAVFGRRRVGKTYLIREFFHNEFDFYHTGIANEDSKSQLNAFNYSLNQFGKKKYPKKNNWFDAFRQLRDLLENIAPSGKKVVFIDEMPWMDTPKSGFVSALEFFWNSYASAQKDIIFIVCGSASSWIVKKLLNNHGGLHNRVTSQIHLNQFSLKECEMFFSANGIVLNRHQIAESYMIFGGIPYYLSLLKKQYGLSQNVDLLCFNSTGKLVNEFENLYASLFRNCENHIAIVNALSTKIKGLTRQEIIDITHIQEGGNLTNVLKELEISGFIKKYKSFGKKERDVLYQLVDFFTLFYYNFMHGKNNNDENFWTNFSENAKHRAWSGYAFEQVCLAHIRQIKQKLSIGGMISNISSWRYADSESGAQIDLVIDRTDKIINLCEVKYSNSLFTIDKNYDENLRNRKELFREKTKTTKALHLTMLTTYGIKHNEYYNNIQSEIILDDLFQ